jgi:hypothetical protein
MEEDGILGQQYRMIACSHRENAELDQLNRKEEIHTGWTYPSLDQDIVQTGLHHANMGLAME